MDLNAIPLELDAQMFLRLSNGNSCLQGQGELGGRLFCSDKPNGHKVGIKLFHIIKSRLSNVS